MLILTRRIGESVYIGDQVRITVLGVRGTQVRIGINAPKDIPVHREEIYYKIKHEQDGDQVPQQEQYSQIDELENSANTHVDQNVDQHVDQHVDQDDYLEEAADPNNS